MKPSFPVILYLVFVFGLLSLARLAMQSPPDLVHEDYYQRGLTTTKPWLPNPAHGSSASSL